MKNGIDDAKRAFRRSHEAGSGAIAEQVCDVAIRGLTRGYGRHFFRSHYQHIAVERHEPVRESEREKRTGAGEGEINGGDTLKAESVGNGRCGSGKTALRGA